VQQEKPVARSGGLSSFGMIGIFQSRFTSLMMNDPQATISWVQRFS
jgi:hypothetical protein